MKVILSTCCAAALLGSLTTGANALITADSMGDTTNEQVFRGYAGNNESLALTLSNYVDPITHLSRPITRPDGNPLVIGDVLLGENPDLSDQLQFQRYLVSDQDETIKLTYLGVGQAGYKSIFSIYTYDMNQDPSTATLLDTPMFVQNVDTPGLDLFFTIPKDHYFGFALNANGFVSSDGHYFTENFRNTDNAPGRTTDHFLTFDTNLGLMLDMEDLAFSGGKLGDQDYEDMLVAFITKGDGTSLLQGAPVAAPEPVVLGGIASAAGLLALLRRRGRAD